MASRPAIEGLLAVGLNHHTAPVEVRERLALDEEAVRHQLDTLVGQGLCSEAMLLSTCNRVELYAMPTADGDIEGIRDWFRAFRAADGSNIDSYLFWKRGREAIVHLFNVASSLDSLIVGEPQILGQVKDAVRVAQDTHSLGRVLGRLSQRTLSVAKRVRSETDIGRFRVGIGNAGVDLATQIFGELDNHRALLIGVGEMGTQVARALQSGGLEELLVANRTHERAVEVAAEYRGTAITYDRVEEYLARVDIVITATGATQPILDKAGIRRALRARRFRPLFLVDLGVPRNIAPDVGDLDEAYLFNIDDLARVMDAGKQARQVASEEARLLVEREADQFLRSMAEADLGPKIGLLTKHYDGLRQGELERSKRLLQSLDDEQREALDKLTRALVKKVLHTPLQRMRNAARDGDLSEVRAILSMLGHEDDS